MCNKTLSIYNRNDFDIFFDLFLHAFLYIRSTSPMHTVWCPIPPHILTAFRLTHTALLERLRVMLVLEPLKGSFMTFFELVLESNGSIN